jgi:hypothetical protein
MDRRTLLMGGGLEIVALTLRSRVLHADGFALIRNSRNHSDSVRRAQLKDMYTGRRKAWPGGEVVQVVLGPNGSPELKWLAEAVIGVPEPAFVAKIKQETFKGEMRRPIVAASDRDCLAAVARFAGGVGVIHAETARALAEELGLLSVV